MADYTPSTARVCIDFCNAAIQRRQPDGSFMTMEEADAAFDRWMADVRASVLAEQGEPEGRRWFSAAYRGRNGNVIPIGDENTLREFPEAIVEEFRREDPDGPEYFLASRILPPWLPEENGENDG